MARHARFRKSVASSGIHIECMNPEITETLAPEQLSALHVCKHEIIAALFRLYMHVPQDVADELIGPYFKLPVNDGD